MSINLDITPVRISSSPEFQALLQDYLDDCKPQGRVEHTLVRQLVRAQWRRQHYLALSTAMLNDTIEQMAKENPTLAVMDGTVRTALAFAKLVGESSTLDKVNNRADRYGREWHRALNTLRAIQKQRREKQKLQNEPGKGLTPVD